MILHTGNRTSPERELHPVVLSPGQLPVHDRRADGDDALLQPQRVLPPPPGRGRHLQRQEDAGQAQEEPEHHEDTIRDHTHVPALSHRKGTLYDPNVGHK